MRTRRTVSAVGAALAIAFVFGVAAPALDVAPPVVQAQECFGGDQGNRPECNSGSFDGSRPNAPSSGCGWNLICHVIKIINKCANRSIHSGGCGIRVGW